MGTGLHLRIHAVDIQKDGKCSSGLQLKRTEPEFQLRML